MTKFIKIALLLMLLPAVSLYANEKAGLIPFAMIPHWSPQAQFAGYYVAREKGIYQKHGIDMVILTGGPERPASEYLKDGRADFAIMWLTTAIRQFDQGVRLVHLGQAVPRSSMMLVAKKSRHIRTPADMNGKKVGLWGGDFAIPPRAFFMKYGLEVKEMPQSGTVNLFLRGGVDVASAMWYNEYHTILNAGIDPEELDLFPLVDYGLNFPEDGLYMLESAYRNNPGLAEAFVKASFEGWDYAFSHPEEAIEITIGYMRDGGIPANRVHQKWMLSKMQDLILPADGNQASGKLNKTDFDAVADFLLHAGLIREMPDYRRFTGELHDND
jgi:NitT/TauT family transport system substrate-binding protein